jgi:capsular exopolysaccharide synthesis family protein
LRNNIAFTSPDQPKRIFAVTSSTKGEGKSTIAANLAIALGLDGKRVIVLDADLRRPSVHKTLHLTRDIGFTNVVVGTAQLEQAIQTTTFENVWAVTSGPIPPRPSEFLNSQHARDVVTQLAAMYDVVIVDSPPCTGLSDFQVIGTFVDGVLLVGSVDRTIRGNLLAALRMLRQMHAPVLGLVINRLTKRWSPYGSYSYYYYYYSYYGEEEAEKKALEAGASGRQHKKKKRNQ